MIKSHETVHCGRHFFEGPIPHVPSVPFSLPMEGAPKALTHHLPAKRTGNTPLRLPRYSSGDWVVFGRVSKNSPIPLQDQNIPNEKVTPSMSSYANHNIPFPKTPMLRAESSLPHFSCLKAFFGVSDDANNQKVPDQRDNDSESIPTT